MITREMKILLLLRVGLAFSFFYAAIASLIDPLSWVGYFPQFVRHMVPSQMLLMGGFSFVQLVVGGWILSGKNIFIPSVIAVALLLGIILFNISQMPILFRDISILFMALALAIANQKRYTNTSPP